ncbi:hypothetical protein EXIGLDRAFT_833510 [Exidia glandulosa HHB12029]|uniref:F-box domain-containing protein n=1 Tax=Exidia glandulosa HHB12029 TaxID=1314781 RepID=A0A165KLE2_EXIGL|nr:hypothetical protein EXIGLDRAFT_833510 [Exidia glandulosa HHB12029]
MPRALTLEVMLDTLYDQELCDVLNMPAPHLVDYTRCSQVPLAPEIFWALPDIPIPALRNIRTLSIQHCTPDGTIFPPVALEPLRHLTSLTFSSPEVEFRTPFSTDFLELLTHLDLLEFYCPHSTVKAFIQAFLAPSHLSHLAILRVETLTFSISIIQDEQSGFVRTVIEPLPNYYSKPDGNEMANPLFRNVEIASQLSTVTVSFRRDQVDVKALDILAFFDLMIAQRCKNLDLRRVCVIDEMDMLSERFRTVVSFAERLWPKDGQFTLGRALE